MMSESVDQQKLFSRYLFRMWVKLKQKNDEVRNLVN